MYPMGEERAIVRETLDILLGVDQLPMGGGGNVEKFRGETGPEIAKKLAAQGVDIVLCTGGCGTCHRSATIVTRCCEEAGMSCCVIAALPPIARQQGAPRITAPHGRQRSVPEHRLQCYSCHHRCRC